MSNIGTASVAEYYNHILIQLMAAKEQCDQDIAKITERQRDWEYRDLEIQIRRARLVLETGPLERERLYITKLMAAAENSKQSSVVVPIK